jgi:multiple sugar transport system substrate-binding protein
MAIRAIERRRCVEAVFKPGLALLAATAFAMSTQAVAQDKLNVWWGKGFYKAEDDALLAAIRKYEDKSGVVIALSQYPVGDMIPKAAAALDAGTPPDVAYADVYDFQVTGKWAYEGRLEDVSDILAPIKDGFLGNTVETTYLYNEKTKRKAYYAFPVKQQTMHIHYWKDMLAEAGYKASDIPTGWKAYWNFWCDRVQPAHRAKTRRLTYAIGEPLGPDSSDTYYSFLTFMDAYNVRLVDDNGKLLVDDPKVRQGLINALRDYTDIRRRDCTPPSSTSWKDPDNNASFHNRTTVLTHNTTISIATKWLDDAMNEALSAEERALAKQNYAERIVTAGFPKKPDGSRMLYRAAVKTGVIFQAAKNKRRAKEFVAFLLQDANLRPYVEGAQGRWFPVTRSGAQSAFWQADPHRKAVANQFGAGTVTFEFTKNHKFTVLNNENVWAKAMTRVIDDNVSVEKAIDEMIVRIKQVAG